MVGNLMDEYRFFHKYPEKELRITGKLFGNLIKENLLEKHILGTALRNVLEAVQKPPTKGHNNKMFLFGWLALQESVIKAASMIRATNMTSVTNMTKIHSPKH